MQVNVLSNAEDGGSVEFADGTYDVDYNHALVHQVVSAYLAGGRRGTKSRKSRAEVRVAEASRGDRRDWDGHEPGVSAVRSGVAAVRHSLPNPGAFDRR